MTAAGDHEFESDPLTDSGLPAKDAWDLFDGKTLNGWLETDFAGKGEVKVEDGKLFLGSGFMTGVTYTNPVLRMNYEITLETMRLDGADFFCGLTFPVGEKPCSHIVGGWGGGVVGLSNIDGEDAANNGHGAGGHSHAGETSTDSAGTNGWLSRFPRICETAPGWSMLPKADGSPDQK